ncbi:MAG: nuclear transport factor 2 family protein [Pseudomonadota bacterium]
MDLSAVAAALVANCRAGTERAALEELYAEDAVSVEALDQGAGRETFGKAGISAKHDWWDENFEVHSGEVLGPFPHAATEDAPDRFAVIFRLSATFKPTGERSDMEEIGLYTVADGKIVREEFFYGPE